MQACAFEWNWHINYPRFVRDANRKLKLTNGTGLYNGTSKFLLKHESHKNSIIDSKKIPYTIFYATEVMIDCNHLNFDYLLDFMWKNYALTSFCRLHAHWTLSCPVQWFRHWSSDRCHLKIYIKEKKHYTSLKHFYSWTFNSSPLLHNSLKFV